MKRVFYRKKSETYDGDEDYIHWLDEYLLRQPYNIGGFPKFRKNWKITIIVENKMR